jgi:hypothetical protein
MLSLDDQDLSRIYNAAWIGQERWTALTPESKGERLGVSSPRALLRPSSFSGHSKKNAQSGGRRVPRPTKVRDLLDLLLMAATLLPLVWVLMSTWCPTQATSGSTRYWPCQKPRSHCQTP